MHIAQLPCGIATLSIHSPLWRIRENKENMAKSKQKFSILKRLKSFKYAFAGLKTLLKEEHNSWIHLLATAFVISAGIVYEISRDEWIYVIVAIGFVINLSSIKKELVEKLFLPHIL